MDREEAAATLSLLRKVVAQARDDTALQNWGLIWLFSAFTNAAGFAGTQYLLEHGRGSPWPYVGLWGVVFLFNGGFIAAFRVPPKGAPSFIERQVWSIWNTLIAAMTLVALLNYLLGLQALLFMPAVACVLFAMTFSVMGALMGRWWYLPAALWAALSLVMAAAPRWQFGLLAGAWLVSQSTAGGLLHRARRRALSQEKGP
ncbi:MAG: hypothetical protein HY909_19440 [Deltaproteobacteria bacterium]|nr:hypothetical protein [Deltaproteobacteria bacterium]